MMFSATRSLNRPWLASGIFTPRSLHEPLSRNTVFASSRLCLSAKSPVLTKQLGTKPQSPSQETKVMSTHAHTQFEESNLPYAASFGDKGKLSSPPAKHLAIVTCMDARIDVVAQLGLKEGDAHIIRNAGGSAKDSIRSLVISQRLLGTREVAVFHHTGCGMQTFTTLQLREKLKASAEEGDKEKVAAAADAIEFLEFSDLDKAVEEEVEFLRTHPLILKETEITGWVYHVESGKVRRVV